MIVVRYFGGVLLGTGGLIKAYRETAKAGLQHAKIIDRQLTYTVQLHFDYSFLPELMLLIKRLEVKLIDQDYSESCFVTLIVTKAQLNKISELRSVKIELII